MDSVEVSLETGFTGESGAAKITERLQKRHQLRAEDAERRKEAKESQTVEEEKLEFFSSSFNTERTSIQELLDSCSGASKAEVTQHLEEATAKTLQLQKFLNDSVLFLTQYELRQAQAALQKLQTSITEIREEALPKKKFTFRARTKAADKVTSSDTPSPAGASDKVVTSSDTPSPAGASDKVVTSSDTPSPAGIGSTKVDAPAEQCGFSNMDNVSLTKTSEEINKQDVLLTDLTNCKVRLLGSPSTLHLKHIDTCEILCGPVSSSVFVDQCRNSILAVPCQQLRTHNTTDTQVYLHVTSRAIVEDCRGVSFAPFSWSYPTLEEDFAVSGLDQDRNNWSQVDDFNWLAADTPSPNWTVIPEADRKTNWDI